MKKILVPVDFSKLSDNAADYAAELARRINAELILINVFYVPVFVHDATIMLPTASQLEKESVESLEKMKKNILKTAGNLKVSYHYTEGIPVDEINLYAILEEIDLIVIGAQGAGYMEKRIFGNTATLLMRTTRIPVLVIKKDVKFKVPEKIVLAVDYAETDNNTSLKPMKQLAEAFNSHVFILNVLSGTQVPVADEIKESRQLAHALKHIPYIFFHTQHKDVIEGINEFAKRHDIHMLVMIARRHSVISRIFHEPYTKEMAFHSEVPLLVLHEKKT